MSVASRRLRLGAALLLAMLAVPATVVAQSAPAQIAAPQPAALSPVAQKFLSLVRANFNQWDLNHDGVLMREEIEIVMQNPRIVGEAAAALAALKIGATKSNHLADTRTFTLADIDAIERQLLDRQKLDTNFIRFFAGALKKLEEQPRQLFAEGLPRMSAIRQDFTTDCYFLSAVGAVAQLNPQAIVRLVVPNRDGSFTVTFPGRPAMRIPAPTETEIATYTISKDGLWLSVLQKAYGIIRIQAEPQQASTRQPLDSVGFRTGPTRVMELFTGHASRGISFPAATHKPLDERLIVQTRAAIGAALRDRRAVTVSSEHHAYAVVAYDAQNDLVTVHNPYDRGGVEKWIEGPKVERNSEGFFVLPTARLVGAFHYLRFEEGRGGATYLRTATTSLAPAPVRAHI
jgi:hypothetical protein